jgi:hypothetical protein
MLSTRALSLDVPEDDIESATSDYCEKSSTVSVSEKTIESVGRFTCFSKLPTEIRLKIWKNALPGPRIIRMELKHSVRVPLKEGEKKKPKVTRLISSRPRPVGLHVCRESRIEALKEYELAFPTKTSPAQTYINFAVDTLVLDQIPSYFPRTTMNTLMDESTLNSKRKKPVVLHREFSKLRFLVIEEQFLWNPRLLTRSNFPNLVAISIIHYGKSNPYFLPAFHCLEECEGPDSQSNPYLAQAARRWLIGMEALARNADTEHPPPKIRFVRPFRGLLQVARDEIKVKGAEVNEAANKDGKAMVGGSAQRRLKMDGTLEA